MDFRGAALPLESGDVELVAGYLGCETAMVRALIEVESKNAGFEDGRPIILNEYHWFYRLTSGASRDRAVMERLAYPDWDINRYPRSQEARYDWLAKAVRIDKEAALKSCSWGLGQVMGFNHDTCGFPTAEEFVRAMMHSKGAQLMVIARFIVGNRLQRHLRNKNWSAFARGYNGRGYRRNDYHNKLRRKYAARPNSEKTVPPIPRDDQLEALLGRAVPALPADPTPVDIAVDASADDRVSKQEIGSIVGGIVGNIGPVTQIVEAAEQTQNLTERIVTMGPWVAAVLVISGVAFLIWRERRRKKTEAREALQASARRA